MSDERVNEIYDDARTRRVAILRREPGSFYYQLEHFSEQPLEMCWIPNRQFPVGIYESEEKAENEARSNVDWLKDALGAA
jgi:hypothetical protein